MVWIAAVWSLAFLVLGVVVPLGAIVQEGTIHLSLDQFFDPVVLAVVRATLKQVLWSTFFSGAFGLLLGLWVAKGLSRGTHSRLISIFSLPMVIPTIVAALGWLIWIGNSGLISRMGIHLDLAYRFEAVILAHSFYNIPWVALAVVQARRLVPRADLDALQTLGARRWNLFVHGVWPQIRWAWATACAQVMGFCSVSFALVLMLGGGPPVQTLETEIFSRIRAGGVDWSGALACAFWELGLTLLPWALVLFFQSRAKYRASQNSPEWAPLRSSASFVPSVTLGQGLVFGLGLFFLLPYFSIYFVSWNLVPSLMSNPEVLKALKLSFALAVWSSSLTIFTAVMVLIFLFHSKMSVRFRSQLGFLFGLPSGISVIVLGLGVWIAYGRWVDPFEGSPAAMILLQVTLFFPLALRALWSVASSSNQRTMDAAKSLGASLVRAWLEVEWSRWRGPLIVAFGSVFGAVLGEVGAVSLFASEKWVSLPGLISQSMQHYCFEEAQILSGILLTTSLLVSLGAMEFGRSLGGAVSE